MAYLVANLPPVKVFVKKQYLYDHQKGKGEFVEGVWVSCKSIQGRALYFETYLPEYGALYDKLPISAFVTSPDIKDDLSLEELELWDAFSYNLTVIEKQSVAGVDVNIYPHQKNGITENICLRLTTVMQITTHSTQAILKFQKNTSHSTY
jgi:hypothetical protein